MELIHCYEQIKSKDCDKYYMLVHLDALTGFYSTLLQHFSRFTPAFFKCLKYGRYIKRSQEIIIEETSGKKRNKYEQFNPNLTILCL